MLSMMRFKALMNVLAGENFQLLGAISVLGDNHENENTTDL